MGKRCILNGIIFESKHGTHSAINIFDEYSMMNPRKLAQYVGFTEELEHYTGDILLVGINYDKKKKIHQCTIEQCKK